MGIFVCDFWHVLKSWSWKTVPKRDNVSFVVWKDLEKENKEFFEAYSRGREEVVIEMEIRQMIRKLQQSESSTEDTGDKRK